MPQQDKHEPVFALIKTMSSAEKRNFKLYATRLDRNREAKFLALFDYLDSVDEYDEQKVLAHCPVKKQQLPNMKAHLYKQILTSIRLLNVQHSDTMQLREQLDFAQILYDKGLYRQSEKILDKVSSHADALEEYSIKRDVVNFQGRLATLSMPREMAVASDTASRQVGELCRQIEANSELSNTSTRAYSLYQQLGYARSQKDLDLINQYFTPRLAVYADRICQMSFHEKFYYYQAQAWCSYIRHDFVNSYRYGRKWVGMFDDHPRMKRVMYDDYMRGCSQILEGLYLMRRHRHSVDYLDSFKREFADLGSLNTNADIIGKRLLYTNKVHR